MVTDASNFSNYIHIQFQIESNNQQDKLVHFIPWRNEKCQSSRLRIGKKLTKKPTPGKDEQMLRVKGLLSFQFGKLLMIPSPLMVATR